MLFKDRRNDNTVTKTPIIIVIIIILSSKAAYSNFAIEIAVSLLNGNILNLN